MVAIEKADIGGIFSDDCNSVKAVVLLLNVTGIFTLITITVFICRTGLYEYIGVDKYLRSCLVNVVVHENGR